METIGVRELRQNASRYLEQVARGEQVQITNHGQLVALLVPASSGGLRREDLIATGQLRPGTGDLLDVQPVTPRAGEPTSAELLAELRDDS
jgi:prevent-host-death family protein